MDTQARMVIVCGKGGVGKTSLSLALGLSRASAGRKVVLVTSHPLPELAVTVSLDGLSAEFPEAARNLFIVHLDPMELVADVVKENFPVQFVARAILNSQLYQNLIAVAPGLKEFYFLVRLQQLAERKASAADGRVLNYDLLLWDPPATGHFLNTLRAARSFDTYLTGPLAAAGAELKRFFSSASHITVLPATTLEEMAVEETIEMSRALESEFQLKPAALLLNLVSPLATAGEPEMEQLRQAGESCADPALRFALERAIIEHEHAARLRAAVPVSAFPVERVRHWSGDLDLLRQIGQSLEAIPVPL